MLMVGDCVIGDTIIIAILYILRDIPLSRISHVQKKSGTKKTSDTFSD
jgi:hypothetical protein